MGRLSLVIALMPPIGLALLMLGLLLPDNSLKTIGSAILFTVAIYIVIVIVVPLFLLAVGLAYRGAYAWRRSWEENKYMLAALAAQVFVGYVSIVMQSLSNLGFWERLGLWLLNSVLLLNLAGECYKHAATTDSDAEIVAAIAGCFMYALYVINLLEKL